MSNLVKTLDEQINIDREVVNVAPKNGIRQIKNLKDTLKEMIDRYTEMDEAIIKEMIDRYDRINSISQNIEIENLQKNLKDLDSLTLNDNIKTPFQKMDFDKLIYNINGYYKKDLATVNTYIYDCIKKFLEVGIPITKNDFNVSEYVFEYMSVLIDEASKGDVNSDKVKSAFDNVYWKCSDLIPHIIVNIRKIYDQNVATIDEYFNTKTEEILRNLNLTKEQVDNKKKELVVELNKLTSIDGRNLLDSFFKEQYNINDFTDDNYDKTYEKLTAKESASISENDKKEIDNNVKKLNKNLVEYVNYLEFKFLIDEVVALKAEKDNGDEKNNKNEKEPEEKSKKTKKSEVEELSDQIKKILGEIEKINKELSGKQKNFLFFKKKSNNSDDKAKKLERDNKILQVKELYLKLDDLKLKESIALNVKETSKLLDVLKLASYNYGFMARSIIKKNSDIIEADIHNMIERIRKFVRLYDFEVINNINIIEKKDLSVVIKDKYKLLGFNLGKENFMEENLDELVKDVQIIDVYNNIKNSNIPIEDIRFAIKAKDILKK